MIEEIQGAPAGVLAFRAVGDVHYEDYVRLMEPAVARARAAGQKLRVVIELGPEFSGSSSRAALTDVRLVLKDLRHVARCAIVTDHRWVRDAVRGARWLTRTRIELFRVGELRAALDWAAR